MNKELSRLKLYDLLDYYIINETNNYPVVLKVKDKDFRVESIKILFMILKNKIDKDIFVQQYGFKEKELVLKLDINGCNILAVDELICVLQSDIKRRLDFYAENFSELFLKLDKAFNEMDMKKAESTMDKLKFSFNCLCSDTGFKE